MSLDERKVSIVIQADGTGAVQSIKDVESAGKQMGATLSKTGQEGADGLGKIGQQAGETDKKMERAIRSMINQAQRLRAEVESSTGAASERMEKLAEIRGIGNDARLQKEISLLKQSEAAHAALAAQMGNVGLTAKQMQASLRGLPAQFTDIFTSLATGQMPITVLLQQGGQIKDMFGGIVPAAKAVGGALLAMVNPWTIAGAAIAVFGAAMYSAEKDMQVLRGALLESGNAAGTTFAALQGMVDRLDEVGGVSRGAASEGLAAFVRTGEVASSELERFVAAAIQLERAGGPAVEKTAQAFKDLGNDPLKAVMKLNDSMNFLTQAGYEQIKALVDVGKTTDAARVAQELYAKALEERAPEMLKNLGYLESGWIKIKNAVVDAWDWMKKVGSGSELDKVQTKIALTESEITNPVNASNPAALLQLGETLRLLKERESVLQSEERLHKRSADLLREQKLQVEAIDELARRGERRLSDEAKLQREIRQETELMVRAKWTQEQIDKRIVQMWDEANKKKSVGGAGKAGDPFAADRAMAEEYEKTMKSIIALSGKAQAEQAKLTKSQEALNTLLQNPLFKAMPETWKQTALQTLYANIAQEQATKQQDEYVQQLKKTNEENARSIASYEKETNAILKNAQDLELKAQKLGQTADKQADLTVAQLDSNIAELEAIKLASEFWSANELELDALNRRIDALKKLKNATTSFGGAQAAQDEARRAEKAWVDAGNSIASSLTDSLVRGFESGKSFADSLIDYIKTAFKTSVVKLVIEPAMKSVVGLGLGLLGAPASAIEKVGSGGVALSGSTGLLGLFGALGGIGSGFTAGLTGALTPGATMSSALGSWLMSSQATTGSLLGTAAGVALPYAAAAYGLYRLISGRGTGRDRDPAKGWQGLISMSGATDTLLPFDPAFMGNPGGGSTTLATLQDYVLNTAALIRSAVTSLGGSVNPLTIGARMATSADMSEAGGLVLSAGGRTLFERNASGLADEAAVYAWLAEQLPAALLVGLQNANLEKPFADYFAKLSPEKATDAQINAAIETATAAMQMAEQTEMLGGAFLQLADISVDARSNILALTGGLDAFLQKTATYLDLYYAEEEKAAIQAYNVAKRLTEAGVEINGLDTAPEFRAIVESLDLSKEAGQKQFAVLLDVAGSFYELVDYMAKNKVDLNQLSGGIFNILPGIDQIVAGPSPVPEDEISKTAPWLPALKETWDNYHLTLDTTMTNLNNNLTTIGSKFAQGVADMASAMASTVASIASRPIDVTVKIQASEVNGGITP
jgi:phage-related minor tail protein